MRHFLWDGPYMRIRSECWLNGLCSIVLNSLIVAVFHVSWGGESGLLVADEPGLTRCELIPLRMRKRFTKHSPLVRHST